MKYFILFFITTVIGMLGCSNRRTALENNSSIKNSYSRCPATGSQGQMCQMVNSKLWITSGSISLQHLQINRTGTLSYSLAEGDRLGTDALYASLGEIIRLRVQNFETEFLGDNKGYYATDYSVYANGKSAGFWENPEKIALMKKAGFRREMKLIKCQSLQLGCEDIANYVNDWWLRQVVPLAESVVDWDRQFKKWLEFGVIEAGVVAGVVAAGAGAASISIYLGTPAVVANSATVVAQTEDFAQAVMLKFGLRSNQTAYKEFINMVKSLAPNPNAIESENFAVLNDSNLSFFSRHANVTLQYDPIRKIFYVDGPIAALTSAHQWLVQNGVSFMGSSSGGFIFVDKEITNISQFFSILAKGLSNAF